MVDGNTIVRLRGSALLYLTSVAAALNGFTRVALGIGIVSTAAATVGITAVPTPLTEINWEGWMFHWTGSLINIDNTIDDSIGGGVVRIPIDSKAMRKINDDETLFGVVEVSGEVGTAVMGFNGSTRMLVKLP